MTKGIKAPLASGSNAPRISSEKMVRMYTSHMEDLKWARNGVLAMVINGEAIHLVQERIKGMGFKNSSKRLLLT